MITAKMDHDVTMLAAEIRLEHWTLIVSSSEFAFVGDDGVSLDALTSLCSGWGANALAIISSGRWYPTMSSLIETGRILINPFQLLASEAALVLLDRVGRMLNHRQVVIQGDNATACYAASTGIE